MDTFKSIGEACGGLLEVAKETIDQSFLMYAKMKVKGHKSGFLNPIVEIPCEDEIIHAGIFSLAANNVAGVQSSGITRRVLARSLNDGISSVHGSETGMGKRQIHLVKVAEGVPTGTNLPRTLTHNPTSPNLKQWSFRG